MLSLINVIYYVGELSLFIGIGIDNSHSAVLQQHYKVMQELMSPMLVTYIGRRGGGTKTSKTEHCSCPINTINHSLQLDVLFVTTSFWPLCVTLEAHSQMHKSIDVNNSLFSQRFPHLLQERGETLDLSDEVKGNQNQERTGSGVDH